MNDCTEKLENKLLEMVQQKEKTDKMLLSLEIFISLLVCIIFFILISVSAFVPMENWIRILLIIAGLIPFIVGICYAIKIEQVAGYYECAKCHHKYVPTYKSVFLAMHINRTRYMKCPKCNEKSWNRKRLSQK